MRFSPSLQLFFRKLAQNWLHAGQAAGVFLANHGDGFEGVAVFCAAFDELQEFGGVVVAPHLSVLHPAHQNRAGLCLVIAPGKAARRSPPRVGRACLHTQQI